jgi:hypothetical protein
MLAFSWSLSNNFCTSKFVPQSLSYYFNFCTSLLKNHWEIVFPGTLRFLLSSQTKTWSRCLADIIVMSIFWCWKLRPKRHQIDYHWITIWLFFSGLEGSNKVQNNKKYDVIEPELYVIKLENILTRQNI